MSRFNDERFRLRPSVSFVPLSLKGTYQFFLSDIRQSFNMAFADELYIQILSELDGRRSLYQLSREYNLTSKQLDGLMALLEVLTNKCVIEDYAVVAVRESDPFRRVKTFIANYIPYHSVDAAWERLAHSHIVVIGAGGVGSWVVSSLAQMGIRTFTILDDDIVKSHNLNRSLFTKGDIGSLKTEAVERMLSGRKWEYYSVTSIHEKLENPERLIELLKDCTSEQTVLINCADYPSVSHTSAIINEVAYALDLPFIIAGGYNMHLSLVGPTIIPGKTPCFHCISHGMEQLKVPEIEGAERIVKEHRNLGNLAPLAAISSSFVTNETLKLLLKSPRVKPTMSGKRGEFNFFTKKLSLEEYRRWDECPCCRMQAN